MERGINPFRSRLSRRRCRLEGVSPRLIDLRAREEGAAQDQPRNWQ